MDAPGIVGREAELGAIDQFLGAAAAASRVLLIEGEVGIGKTTLLAEARARATGSGYTVLGARPIESEIPLDFAALADLLEPVAVSVLHGIPAPQRRALAVALLREEPGEHPPDPRTIATGTLAILRRLADTAPVIVFVDDLPWVEA
ncbi:MAG: ATP-binding protein, partial [Acidimicrobiales bacterium]